MLLLPELVSVNLSNHKGLIAMDKNSLDRIKKSISDAELMVKELRSDIQKARSVGINTVQMENDARVLENKIERYKNTYGV